MDPLISVIFGAVMQKLGDMINEGHNLRKDLKLLLPAIKDDLAVLCGSAEDLSAPRNHRSGKGRQAWIQQIQDLAYEIEDCLDRHSAAVDYEADDSLLRRLLGRAKTMESRTQFAKEISDLKNKVQDAIKRKALIMDVKEEPAADCDCGGGGYVPECELVGIEDPKKEVRDLLLLHRQEEPRPRLKVVSIVGPRGLGKTALAWAVYDSLDGDDEFNCRAKVTASDCVDSKDLLMKILLQVKGDKEVTAADKEEPGRSLRVHLMSKKRYFIIIDDLHLPHYWDSIRHAFPDSGISGRIIVTTSVDKIAKNCSSEGGNVYRMKKLSEDLSRKLFMRIAFGPEADYCEPAEGIQKAVEDVVDKCDGLPLALVSIGRHLKNKKQAAPDALTARDIEETCSLLGNTHQLEKNNALSRILDRTYNSLPEYELRNCLLSVSIFPKSNKNQIKKNRLVRMWLAEGLVAKAVHPNEEDKNADEYFKELIDRNVIQPVVDNSNNTREKLCQIHGVMLDLIVHKSVSENFITLVHRDSRRANNNNNNNRVVRRFSLQNTHPEPETVRMAMQKLDLSCVRSLAIFHHDVKGLGDFRKCKLLRALVLEHCQGLDGDVINSICELNHLKYLSLKGSDVRKLPKRMPRGLKALETLDIRDTEVDVLPVDVLSLPRLAHLLGRFHLPREISRIWTNPKKQRFSPKSSELQTLAGFVLDDESPSVMKHVMVQMKKLRKIKIWFRDNNAPPPAGSSSSATGKPVPPRVKIQFDKANETLSVDFGDRLLQVKVLLTNTLLSYILSLETLQRLDLLSYDLDSKALENLGSLKRLVSLTISSKSNSFGEGKFDVQKGGFPNLELLCFQTPKLPKVSIGEGSMPKLTSLKLLCEDIKGFDVKDMTKLQKLKEVTLLTLEAKQAWEAAAEGYDGRPTVKVYCPCSTSTD